MTPSATVRTGAAAPIATTIGGVPLGQHVVYTDKLHERQVLKERLAAAFRIFAKYGFDEGVGASRFIILRLQNQQH